MTNQAAKPITMRRQAITACFALLCAVPSPESGAATSAPTATHFIEEAESESSATVVFTVSVSVERLTAAPTLSCQLRPNPAFDRPDSAYGFWDRNVQIDSTSGTGSVAFTARLRIVERERRQPLRPDQAVHVRCRLVPAAPPTRPPGSDQWKISQQAPVCPPGPPGSAAICGPNVVKPGAVVEVSGEAR